MSVTRHHLTERDHCLGQIERLVQSHTLHGSESLCKLLRYLAEHALDRPGTPVKEYQIATEVFGRAPDFDPQIDSTVRVQAGRLRLKLGEYYSTEGRNDPILVDLPKGTYLPIFRHHSATVPAIPAPETGYAAEAPTRSFSSFSLSPVLTFTLIALAFALGFLLSGWKKTETARASAQAIAPAPFRVFWSGFTSAADEPWVIFSNGSFVGRPETGMRYFDPARDSKDEILDHYTGIGEVLAVHSLDRVFATLGHNLRVKRGSLFSLDDAENNDLIYIGSPAENLTLRDVPGTREFVFQRLTAGPRKGDLAIINAHPNTGEPSQFLASPVRPLTEDYAVISLRQGLNPARSTLILAGTTTIGTEAAVEYICRQNTLEELLSRVSLGANGGPKPFEALLHVKVTRGVPVESEIVAFRNAPSVSNSPTAK